MTGSFLAVPDEEWVRLWQDRRDDRAREIMVKIMTPTVEQYARSFRNPAETDDLVSVGLCAVSSALDTYRFDRGTTFRTYARGRIYGAMQHYLRDYGSTIAVSEYGRRHGHPGFEVLTAIDPSDLMVASSDPGPEETVVARASMKEAAGTLTPRSRAIFEVYLQSRDVSAAATALGVRPRVVSRVIRQVRLELSGPAGSRRWKDTVR